MNIVAKNKFAFRKQLPYIIMVIPGIIFFLVFKYVPIMGSFIAFKEYNVVKGFFDSPWAGLKQFETLINYPDFKKIFCNTMILGLCKIVFIFPIPVILSLLLNEIKGKFIKKFVQTSIYIPYFISWVIVGGLVFDILGWGGLYNIVRTSLGLAPELLMQKESAFRGVYVLTAIWKDAGWGTVVYLAAISGIDPSLYESASIDGASRLQRVRYLTFPLIIPTIMTLFLLNIGSFLELGFEQVFNLLTPMTYNVGDIFDTYVYRVGILQAQYSFTTAVGLFQSVIGFFLVVTFNKFANRFSDGGLW